MNNYKFFPLVISLFMLLFFPSLRAKEKDLEILVPLLELITDVVEHHRQIPLQPVPIIAIGGCPGVGKTYFTKALLQILEENGIQAKVLPLDHFNLSLLERKKLGTEWDIRHFKYDQLHFVLSRISLNQKLVEKPTCDQLKGEVGSEILDLRECDLLLFDGLYALCSHSPIDFFAYCSFGIFLEADDADIKAWKWVREQSKASPRTSEQFDKHMEAILTEYYQNIAYSRQNATFIIKKDGEHRCVLLRKESAMALKR